MPKCRECGLSAPKGATFCTPEHRAKWHNRRKVRGAELYDLVMAIRYERDKASEGALMTIMSNLARAYRDADKASREGRESWNLKEALERMPLAFGAAGDGR